MLRGDYLKQARQIWQQYVPKTGQAKYVQGELLRAVEKLRDEAHRNGNGNFHAKCHGLLIDYLRQTLTTGNVFDKLTICQILADLDLLAKPEEPYLEDDVFDRLCERVVDWCIQNSNPILHQRNDELTC